MQKIYASSKEDQIPAHIGEEGIPLTEKLLGIHSPWVGVEGGLLILEKVEVGPNVIKTHV